LLDYGGQRQSGLVPRLWRGTAPGIPENWRPLEATLAVT